MKKAGFKSGSALLVVLGMLAFMVVSAVAFSAYMRYSRLPSSYLRRTTASRELAKAALARAIDEIDHAIGENVHPGIGARYYEEFDGVYEMDGNAYKVGDDTKRTKNYWRNHIYIGTNFLASSFLDTAPVLTLEGLAYIPPPYVDHARYYGRLSSAAEWKTFDFDAGRYAFVAIDVSDALDVNRLSANMSRSSAGNGRISLAYLFENDSHSSAGSAMSKWDEMMEKYRDYDSNTGTFSYNNKIPLTSLADLNMAIGKDSFGDIISPWYKYVSSGNSGSGFYCGSERNMHRMPFVTDSYFPTTNDVNDINGVLDLAYGENQPFDPNELMKANNKQSMDSAIERSSNRETWKRLKDSISLLGVCALWDYLDVDSYPISLALPTIERVPMITAMKVNLGNANVKITETIDGETTYDNPEADPRTATRTYIYALDGSALGEGLNSGTVETLAMYPFCRDDGQMEPSSYKTEGYLTLFLSDADMPLHPESVADSLKFKKEANAGLVDGVVRLPFSKNGTLTPKAKDISEETDAIVKVGNPMFDGVPTVVQNINSTPLLKVTVSWQQEKDPNTGMYGPEDPEFTNNGGATITAAESNFTIYNKDGSVKSNAISDIKDANFEGGVEVVLNAAVSFGIKEGDEYVDLVPACAADDSTLNNRSSQFSQIFTQGANGYPLMRMDTGVKLKLSVADLHTKATGGSEQLVTIDRPVLVIDDPVYNHEPESWYSEDASWTFTVENWIKQVKANHSNINDIFRNTSDQGYMQSVYELAFIPRVAINNDFDQARGNYSSGSNRTAIPTDRDQTLNRDLMWKSYDPLVYDDQYFSFDDIGVSSGDTGYHINPYTSDISIMMAAFANTPLDWAAASTNFDNRVNKAGDIVNASEDVATFNKKYAWCGYNSDAKLVYEELEAAVDNYMSQVRGNVSQSEVTPGPGEQIPYYSGSNLKHWITAWEDVWSRTQGSDITKSLMDAELKNSSVKLYGIDKKFLYGYWKECFAVRQQLFLIFVRAEPMMMGGGSMSKIPPQLGARAVALVWRDPTPYDANAEDPSYKNNDLKGAPHRTRVLFYKTLD